ncbi:hypothetical protein EYR41_002965 [Orbilia oligospora]|uniref:Uncharacterized protein n=1 Tax=Orbilia oligospora TaxID=2813651 RepID=A0A7C8KFM8_ORBOL|nr:hypothetical protein TWF751_004858 [Orbilia oligospora]TGJ70956.1 hypothetical protein EYR41_002965 [Orbilia oligospora]
MARFAALNLILLIFSVFFCPVFGFFLPINDPISNLSIADFPKSWNTNFTDSWNIDLEVPQSDPKFAAPIQILINDTYYCLTDRSIPGPPRTNVTFATLEKCSTQENFDKAQLWQGPGYFSTKVARDNNELRLPGFGPGLTFYRSQWRRNYATKRCIMPYWGFPGRWIDMDIIHLNYLNTGKGFVALAPCGDGETPKGYGIHSLRTEVVDVPFVYGNYTERYSSNLRFDQPAPDLRNGKIGCPADRLDLIIDKPNQNSTLRDFTPTKASELKEQYLNSLMLPNLIPASLNGTQFYPAIFGCVSRMLPEKTMLPYTLAYVYQIGLNIYVDKMRACQQRNEKEKELWVASDEFHQAKDYWETAQRCHSNPGLDGILNQMCIELQNRGLLNLPPPDPERPPNFLECDEIATLDKSNPVAIEDLMHKNY